MSGGPVGEPFDPARFAQLEAHEDRLFWFRVRNMVIREVVAPLVEALPPGYQMLEVGCGTGNVLRMLDALCRQGEVVGLEKYREGVDIARRRVTCEVRQGDVRELVEGDRYELIGMFDVLEHIEDDQGILEKLRGHLTGAGSIVLTVPAYPSLWSDFDVRAHHQRRYTVGSLRKVLEASGYEIDYITHFMAALVPAMKLRRKKSATDVEWSEQNEMSEKFDIGDTANSVAYWMTRPEVLLVRHKLRIPFGTSILASAHPKKEKFATIRG